MSFLFCPLSDFVKPGKGDDIVVTIDHESGSKYGSIGIGNNRKLFNEACKIALGTKKYDEPIMVAVNDSGVGDTPRIFTNEVIVGGKKHHLAVIFNAELDQECSNDFFAGNSFRLVMSDCLDKKGLFSERIVFSPGEVVTWNKNDLLLLLS